MRARALPPKQQGGALNAATIGTGDAMTSDQSTVMVLAACWQS